ncbi:MAG: hypothetical protein ACI35W_01135 [Anaeroplasmataceae bacterium]
MKKEYQRPEIVEEVVELEDVIAASNGGAGSIAGSIKKSLSELFGIK